MSDQRSLDDMQRSIEAAIQRWEDPGEPATATGLLAKVQGATPGTGQPSVMDAGALVPPEKFRLSDINTHEEPTPVQPPSPQPRAPLMAGKPASLLTPSGGAAGISQPAGASAGAPDWQDLANRLNNAQMRASGTRAAEHMFANAGSHGAYQPDLQGGQWQVEQAKAPLELAQARQQYEAKDMAMQAQKALGGVKAAEADPNSLQSQKARAAIKSFFGDSIPLPPDFDSWSARDAAAFAKPETLVHIQAQKAAVAERARKVAEDEADKVAKGKAAQEKLEAGQKALEASRKNFSKQLIAQGVDPNIASQEDINRAIQITHNNATESGSAASRGLVAAAQAETRAVHDEAEKERARKLTEDVPPGYEVAPNANPGAESRKKFTELVNSQSKLKGLTASMRKELQGVDITDKALPGPKKQRLNQLATAIGIESKNVAGLGALSGPDMDLMNAMASNPTNAWNLFADMAGNMDGLDSWADNSVKAGGKAYGLRPTSGGAGRIRVKILETGQTGSIPMEKFDPKKHVRLGDGQ